MFFELYVSFFMRLVMIEACFFAPAFLTPDKRKVFTEKFGSIRN